MCIKFTELKFISNSPSECSNLKTFLGEHAPRPDWKASALHCTQRKYLWFTYDQPKFQMANQIYFWLAILSEQNFILILYSELRSCNRSYSSRARSTSYNQEGTNLGTAVPLTYNFTQPRVATRVAMHGRQTYCTTHEFEFATRGRWIGHAWTWVWPRVGYYYR